MFDERARERTNSGKHKYSTKAAIMLWPGDVKVRRRVRFHWRVSNFPLDTRGYPRLWGERGMLGGKFLQKPKDFASYNKYVICLRIIPSRCSCFQPSQVYP